MGLLWQGVCSQSISPANNAILFNGLISPRRLEMYNNVWGYTKKCCHLLGALLVIVRRGRLPVRVIILVGDEHLSRVHVHVDELNTQVLL